MAGTSSPVDRMYVTAMPASATITMANKQHWVVVAGGTTTPSDSYTNTRASPFPFHSRQRFVAFLYLAVLKREKKKCSETAVLQKDRV